MSPVGEIADAMIDGSLCQTCGVDLGEAVGYPRNCWACSYDSKAVHFPDGIPKHKVPCPTCGKRVKAIGLAQHQAMVHGSGSTVKADEG